MRLALIMTIATSAVVSLLVGCGEKSNGPSANVDMNASCFAIQQRGTTYAGTACNYNYSAVAGFTNYNSTSTYGVSGTWASGGCPSGTAMAYSDRKGLGCVDTTYLSYGVQAARYQLAYNGVFSLIPATYGYNNGSNTGYNTYGTTWGTNYGSTTNATVFRVCDDSDPCPSNLRCLSPYGVQRMSGAEVGLCFY